MPPVAEEMAGGNPPNAPAGSAQNSSAPASLQPHPPHHPKKKHYSPKNRGSFARCQGQHEAEEGKTKGLLDARSDAAGSASDSTSNVSVLSDLPDASGETEISYNMMSGLRSVKPKENADAVGTMDRYSKDPNIGAEFFKKEPCLYSHRMFDRASKIFLSLKESREARMEKRKHGSSRAAHKEEEAGRGEKKKHGHTTKVDGETSQHGIISGLDFRNAKEQKLTYELAFSALKFETVFEDMLDDCAFFSVYPDLRDMMGLVMVVLWDYQSRKFQPRIQFDADELIEDITVIERALLDQKVKLAACLARRRIKASAPNIDYLLPDKFRTKGDSSKPLPVYAWVNTLKIAPSELLNRLKTEKYTQLWMPPKNAKEFPERSFYLDPHCSDVLVFSMDCNALIQDHPLVEQGYLVRQDKSSCLAANSVVYMLGDEQEVIAVNPGGGLTAAHVAVLMKQRKGGVVVVTDAHSEEFNKMMRVFELLGVTRYLRVIQEHFLAVDMEDIRLKNVRAALITAECSKSAIPNIVNYIVTEGENLTMLQDISDQADQSDDNLNHLQSQHLELLRHALKLPRILGVTYLTRSLHTQENEAVVQRAIEYVNMIQVPRHYRPWRVIPPVVPFSADEVDEQTGILGKAIFFQPTAFMNGCFIVCIAREPDDTHNARSKAVKTTSKTKLTSSGSSESTKSKGPRRSSKPPK